MAPRLLPYNSGLIAEKACVYARSSLVELAEKELMLLLS
jgi:hypothetical protein